MNRIKKTCFLQNTKRPNFSPGTVRAAKYILHTVHTVRIERKRKEKMNHTQEAYTASL